MKLWIRSILRVQEINGKIKNKWKKFNKTNQEASQRKYNVHKPFDWISRNGLIITFTCSSLWQLSLDMQKCL